MKQLFVKQAVGLLLVIIFCINSLSAQTISINGREVNPVKKSIINPKIEFYQVRDSAQPGDYKNYIKSGGIINATIFSEIELKTFVATGIISSLGKVYQKQYKDSLVSFITKGEVAIFFLKKGTALKIWELPAGILNIFEEQDNTTPQAKRKRKRTTAASTTPKATSINPRLQACLDGCEETFVACHDFPFGEEYCMDVYTSCCEICLYNYRGTSGGGIAKEAPGTQNKAGYTLETVGLTVR